MDYEALKAELLAGHPETGPYSANSEDAAAEINAVNIASVISEAPGKMLMDQTDPTEYDGLTDAKKSQWLAYTSHGEVDTSVGGMAQTIGIDIFGGGSQTATNIGTARQTTISRAEELGFGLVRAGDVEYARSI
jgi:hypothetical protein